MVARNRTIAGWNDLARRRLRAFVRVVSKSAARPWQVEVKVVTTPTMIRLNQFYRKKAKPTDVLSFPAPDHFRKSGHLGELVICLSVLKRQAKEMGHRPEFELEVLLVHGLLHLLGMDHEKGGRRAVEMARWEVKLLKSVGLIKRTHSGNSKI